MTTYGPYAPFRRIGNMLFISGQVGINPTAKTASTDITVQTEQAVHNLEAVLQSAGSSLQNVVKTTVFVTDMDNFAAMNAAYERAFEPPRPARSTVAVRELPRVAGETPILVEIEAIAASEVA